MKCLVILLKVYSFVILGTNKVGNDVFWLYIYFETGYFTHIIISSYSTNLWQFSISSLLYIQELPKHAIKSFHSAFTNRNENENFSIRLGIGSYFIIVAYLNYHSDNMIILYYLRELNQWPTKLNWVRSKIGQKKCKLLSAFWIFCLTLRPK